MFRMSGFRISVRVSDVGFGCGFRMCGVRVSYFFRDTTEGVSNTPEDVSNTPEGVSNTPEGVPNTPDGVSNTL